MANNDPPAGSGITINVDITNISNSRSTDFFIYCITSKTVVTGDTLGLEDVINGDNLIKFIPVTADFDSVFTPDSFPSGITNLSVGTINISPNETVTVRFTIQSIDITGIYDLAIRAGTFSPPVQRIIEIQDTLILEDFFEIT